MRIKYFYKFKISQYCLRMRMIYFKIIRSMKNQKALKIIQNSLKMTVKKVNFYNYIKFLYNKTIIKKLQKILRLNKKNLNLLVKDIMKMIQIPYQTRNLKPSAIFNTKIKIYNNLMILINLSRIKISLLIKIFHKSIKIILLILMKIKLQYKIIYWKTKIKDHKNKSKNQ